MASSTKGTSNSHVSKKNTSDAKSEHSSNVNQFANDGSFFEMYRKRMEELEKSQNVSTSSSSAEDVSSAETKDDQKQAVKETGTPSLSTTSSSGSLLIQGKRKLALGKMGGASKQLQIKKKKEEKELKKKKEKGEEKASGWDLYMEEVKKYRETTCSEEVDRVRPLVK